MTKSFAPGTHCFPAVKHDMSLKSASVTDHGRGSRDEDSVTIIFVMITVMYVSITSRASSVVSRCSGFVIRVIFLDNYRIVEGAQWGSRDQSCLRIEKSYQIVVSIVEWGKGGKMNRMVLWVENVLFYGDGNGFFLLGDVSWVVKWCRVLRCKLLEKMLQQILEEEQVHFVHVVYVCQILLLVD